MNDKILDQYLVHVNNSQIEQYDDTHHSAQDSLRGIRFKKFVRMDSSLFKDLIEEIKKNPKCGYETSLNDLIRGGYTPKHISILQKEDNSLMSAPNSFKLGHFKDVCASRILNFLECPTSYETVMEINRRSFSCSVDFGKFGEDFYTVGSIFPIHKNASHDLFEIVPQLVEKLSFFSSRKNIEDKDNSMFADFVSDYCYSRMVRKYILSDSDYGYHNVGLIHNLEKNSFRLAPNFDLEWAFDFIDDRPTIFTRNKELKNDLYYLKVHQPKVLHKFTTNLQKLCSNGQYEKLITEVIGKNEISTKFVDRFGQHLAEITRECNLHLEKGGK